MSGPAEGPVRFRSEDGVGRIVLDRPPLNVLDPEGLGGGLEKLMDLRDPREGLATFLEQREPAWEHA